MSEYRDEDEVVKDRNQAMGLVLVIALILLAFAAWIVLFAPNFGSEEAPVPPVEQEVEPLPVPEPPPVEPEEVPESPAKEEVSLLVVPSE